MRKLQSSATTYLLACRRAPAISVTGPNFLLLAGPQASAPFRLSEGDICCPWLKTTVLKNGAIEPGRCQRNPRPHPTPTCDKPELAPKRFLHLLFTDFKPLFAASHSRSQSHRQAFLQIFTVKTATTGVLGFQRCVFPTSGAVAVGLAARTTRNLATHPQGVNNSLACA